jgi:hypothetical protein
MSNIFGTPRNDTLIGTDGDDEIFAGDGNDTLDGGLGNNRLYGGAGNDTYLIHSRNDYIYDESGNDSGTIYVDFYKTNPDIEHWTWAPGVQKLSYWIDALLPGDAPGFQALLGPSKVFYYYFPTSPPGFLGTSDTDGFQAFNEAQMAFAKRALAYISSVIDVQFVETDNPDGANTISFADNHQSGSAGYTYYPNDLAIGNDVFINDVGSSAQNLTPSDGEYSAYVLIHELGHALGLKHPFLNEAGDSEGPALPDAEESSLWSVLSYKVFPQNYQLKYSPLDIAALQYLYGASKAVQADNDYVLNNQSTNIIWDGGGTDTLDGAAQTQAITAYLEPGYWGFIGQKSDLISSAGQITVNFGSVIENALGGSGNDVLTGNAVANNLFGNAGNDVLIGLGGDDVIDGGAGIDRAVYLHPRSDFVVTQQNTNGVLSETVRELNASAPNFEGVDTLQNIERIQFSDITVALDITGDAGQAYRLYQAAFNRSPDLAGLGYWIASIDAGADLVSVANNFILSDEFKTLYGSANSNTAFINTLYQNVLHRSADEGGLNYWLSELNAGSQSRASVLIGFSESTENMAQVIGKISDGIDFIAYGLVT